MSSPLNWVEPSYIGAALALVVLTAVHVDSGFDLAAPIALTLVVAGCIIYTPELAAAAYAALAGWVLFGLANAEGGTAAASITLAAMVLAIVGWRLGSWSTLVGGSVLVAAAIVVVGWGSNPAATVVVVVVLQWYVAGHYSLGFTRLISAIVALVGALAVVTVGTTPGTPVVEAASAGLADLLDHLPAVDVPPSRVWLVGATVLYLAWHRALEMHNDGRGAHAVEIRLVDDTVAGASTVLAHVQRTLRRASIGAPPEVPGERLKRISEIEQTTADPSTSAVMTAVRAAVAIGIPPHGLVAELEVTGEEASGVGFVLLRRRDGHVVSTYWEDVGPTGPTLADVGEAIGHRIARQIWTRSAVRPQWEVWRQRTGRDLALYSDAVRERSVADDDDAGRQAEALVEALTLSPGNSLIRFELASRREATRSYWEALELYLTIAIDHPTLATARYRLAVVLLTLAADLDAIHQLGRAVPPEMDRAVQKLEETRKISPEAAQALTGTTATPKVDRLFARLELARFALAELRSIQGQRMRARTAFRALVDQRQRRDEWARLARPHVLRHDRLTVRTARAAAALQALRLVAELEARTDVAGGDPATAQRRLGDSALVVYGSVERATRQAECGWQAHYNAACFYSRVLELAGGATGLPLDEMARRPGAVVRPGRDVVIDKAFTHLDKAVRSPDSGLSRDAGAYYRRDRDLIPLQEAAPGRWARWEEGLPRPLAPEHVEPG